MTNSNITINYPEMWGNSEAEIQAENTFIGKKSYRVVSKKPIEIKRGIEAAGKVDEIGANNIPNKRAGWYKYYMTQSAFEKLASNNSITLNCLLD